MILLIGFKSDRSGFTLIEILLVLVLLTIIVGLAVPRFSSTYKSLQLQRAAQDLGYLMRYAQSRAVIKRGQIRLEFDVSNKSYWLTERAVDQKESNKGGFERLTGRLGRKFTIEDDIVVKAKEVPILFYPDGKIDKCRLRLCRKKKCFILSTEEQWGKVFIYEEE